MTSKEIPSDLELMQFYDGELEEPRRSEVLALLQSQRQPPVPPNGHGAMGEAVRKIEGMQLVGIAIRQNAHDTAARFGDLDLAGKILQEAQQAEQGRPAKNVPDPARVRPANDNSRRIFTFAGLAAAAAAAVVLWGQTTPGDGQAARPAVTTAQLAAPATATTAEPAAPATEVVEEHEAGGVEVAAVEFGSRSGAIFHVPTEIRGATTTVLWLSDE